MSDIKDAVKNQRKQDKKAAKQEKRKAKAVKRFMRVVFSSETQIRYNAEDNTYLIDNGETGAVLEVHEVIQRINKAFHGDLIIMQDDEAYRAIVACRCDENGNGEPSMYTSGETLNDVLDIVLCTISNNGMLENRYVQLKMFKSVLGGFENLMKDIKNGEV